MCLVYIIGRKTYYNLEDNLNEQKMSIGCTKLGMLFEIILQ